MNQAKQQLWHHGDNCLCSECEKLSLGSYRNDSQVHFIRHGLSVANAGEKTLTPDGIILSETGHHQANKVSETLALQTPDKIWYSRYIRTQQTANPTLRKFPDIPHEVFPYIHEKTYLDAELCANTNHAERREMREEYRTGGADYRHGASAETFREFIARIDQTLDYMKNMGPGKLEYMFSHEMLIQGLLGRLKTLDHPVNDDYKTLAKNNRSEPKIENTQIVKFVIRDGIVSVLNSK